MKNSTDVKLCPAGSVGAIIRRGEEYLMLYRKVFPLGLAGPAGHLEPDETPEQALRRELREETSIEADSLRLILHETYPNSCKRGFTAHEWWVFEVEKWSEKPALKEKDKHEFVKFMTATQIKEYCRSGKVDLAWGAYILPSLDIISYNDYVKRSS